MSFVILHRGPDLHGALRVIYVRRHVRLDDLLHERKSIDYLRGSQRYAPDVIVSHPGARKEVTWSFRDMPEGVGSGAIESSLPILAKFSEQTQFPGLS